VEICLIDGTGARSVPDATVDELLSRDTGFVWVDFDHLDAEEWQCSQK
jgi:hypothetical protein